MNALIERISSCQKYPIHRLHKNNLSIREVSTLMYPRQGGRSSIEKKAAFYMINVLLGMIISAMRPQVKRESSDEL